jgi:hypothetical protein
MGILGLQFGGVRIDGTGIETQEKRSTSSQGDWFSSRLRVDGKKIQPVLLLSVLFADYPDDKEGSMPLSTFLLRL